MSQSSVISNLANTSNSNSSQGSDRLATDKFTFLKLLIAQLTNQDPLDPTDDKEFVAQLAQFSSLEQLQEINEGVTSLNDTMYQGQLMSATSFIGKAVVVSGSQVVKANDANGDIVTTYVYYTADEAFKKGYVTIMDESNTTIIRQDTIDGHGAGSSYYLWDGKMDNGKEADAGRYNVIIAAVDENDKSVFLETKFEAQVTSVYLEDGVYYLALTGGRNVPLSDVVEIGEVATSTTSNDTVSYASLASDQAAKASLAADSAAAHEASIDVSMTSAEAKSAASSAIAAAQTARAAADEAEKVAQEARTAAESAQTAATLSDYNDAKEWAEKAAGFADAAEASAVNAKAKALAIDPDLEF
ncbi:hypothetical protein LJC26_01055 [Desulfovibrio sp. OttesenSCG-928-O18]|nr:hypothetical protein [Desulfovibrio sp. OttesenSCG-928-O18]